MEWIRGMYDEWSDRVEAATGENLPSFDEFWEEGQVRMPVIENVTLLGRVPERSRWQSPANPKRKDRNRVGDDRSVRLRRLPGVSELVRRGNVTRIR